MQSGIILGEDTADKFREKKRGERVFVVCAEHVEMAIDEFVDEYEQSPDIYLLAEISFTAWEVPARCEYCEKPPKYLVV